MTEDTERRSLPLGAKGDPARVREALRQSGKKEAEVAGALSISPRTLNHYLKLYHPYVLTGSSLLRFASVVGVPVDSLLPEEAPAQPATPKERGVASPSEAEQREAFGKRLREAMVRRDVDSDSLAEKIGVTRNAPRNWTAGRSYPWQKLLPLICKTLEVPIEWLRYGKGKSPWEEEVEEAPPVEAPPEDRRVADPILIRRAANGSGLSWRELANELGIGEGSLGGWMRGDTQVFGEKLVRFALATKRPLSFFISEDSPTAVPVGGIRRGETAPLPPDPEVNGSRAVPSRLREAMFGKRVSKRDISRRLRVSSAKVGLWMSGGADLEGRDLEEVAKVVGRSVEWLRGSDTPAEPRPLDLMRNADRAAHVAATTAPFIPIPEEVIEAEQFEATVKDLTREMVATAKEVEERTREERGRVKERVAALVEEEKERVAALPVEGEEKGKALPLTLRLRVLSGALMQLAAEVEDLEHEKNSLAREKREVAEAKAEMEAQRKEASAAYELMQEQMSKLLGR